MSRPPPVKQSCEVCRTDFFAPAHRVTKGIGRFCSRKCSGIAHRKPDGYVPARKVERQCEHCKTTFLAEPCLVAKGGGRYCSKRCSNTVNTAARNRAKAAPMPDRFWNKVDQSGGPDACWPWMGTRKKSEHGHFRIDGHVEQCGRIVLSLTLGLPLRDKWWACHRCDNPPCCNPAHLFVGDSQANTADMVAKKRHAFGEKSGMAKLTDDAVRLIRSMSGSGPKIAERFGVKKAAIYAVRARRTWRHIP